MSSPKIVEIKRTIMSNIINLSDALMRQMQKHWRVSWHERDRVMHDTPLKWRDFADHTEAVDWLHHCEERPSFYLWPYLYNIEKKSS
jgi:hypothetical protein